MIGQAVNLKFLKGLKQIIIHICQKFPAKGNYKIHTDTIRDKLTSPRTTKKMIDSSAIMDVLTLPDVCIC